MTTITYTERINLKFGLTSTTIENTEMLNNICLLEERTHNYLSQWYSYVINRGMITVFNVPVSEIESVIRIVNGFNELY